MTQYDEHGFYTREWAEANIPGFTELGTCCQQEVLLFPNMPIACVTEQEFIPAPPGYAPMESSDESYYGGGGVIGPGAGALAATAFLLPDGGGHPSAYSSVPEPSAGLLLLPCLLILAIVRKTRGS